MTTTDDAGSKYKNYNLLSFCKEYKIVIPKLQRDYAQGRINDRKVEIIREDFIKVLVDHLKDSISIKLDFVYGDIRGDIFYPLDGQQRLTTLFLLHWYLAYRQNKIKEIKTTLLHFTYETRASSRTFCNYLTERNISEKEGDISIKIEDSAWFKTSWKKDPTISAMITMLKTIEKTIGNNDIGVLCDNLLTTNIINFDVIILENFGLSDDLYIKLNARGEELTNFEKFKAKFEKSIEDGELEKNIAETQMFSFKIDGEWTKLFWKYQENYKIDDSLFKFITNIAIFCYAKFDTIFSDSQEDAAAEAEKEARKSAKRSTDNKTIRIENRIELLNSGRLSLEVRDFETKEKINYLKNVLDLYCKDVYREDSSNEFKKVRRSFKEFLTSKTYADKLLFFAQTEYLLKNKPDTFKDDGFNDFMRVVRNIITNSDTGAIHSMLGAINLIDKLLSKCQINASIYALLASDSELKSSFASEQVNEEREKAKLMQSDSSLRVDIFKAEDTKYCRGKIRLLLDVAKKENFEKERFQRAIALTEKYLCAENVSFTLIRALLTCENPYYQRSYSYNLGLPKYAFVDIDRNKYQLEVCVKKLFNKMIEEKIDSIETIIENFSDDAPEWRKKLIIDENLLANNCGRRHFSIDESDKSCYLYGEMVRPNSREECFKV